jgi:glycerol-3-phosphate dehydrogenase (NAD(P)+)
MSEKITVVGGGSFGTAVAYHLAKKHMQNPETQVVLYVRNEEVVKEIATRHTNTQYAKNVILPANLKAVSLLQEAVRDSDFLLLGVPAQTMREVCRSLRHHIFRPLVVVNLAKGLEIGTFKRMSQVVAEELRGIAYRCSITTLGGPSFAHDILADRPVGVTVGGANKNSLMRVRSLFDTSTFDVKITYDETGVELGGVLKNVFAIMCGMMDGLNMGTSIYGDFLTRSIVDMKNIATRMGARASTLNGRAGLGDLSITCTPQSRNFRFGREYVLKLQEAQKNAASGQVNYETLLKSVFKNLDTATVEGYYSLSPVYEFCERHNMFVPIVRALYSVLYCHDCTPQEAVYNYRMQDKIRLREGRKIFSHVLSFLFPKLWYRKERGLVAQWLNRQEEQAVEKNKEHGKICTK